MQTGKQRGQEQAGRAQDAAQSEARRGRRAAARRREALSMAREHRRSQSKGVCRWPKARWQSSGLIGILYGLSALIFSSHGFALHIPHGAVHGKKWIGLEVNGWSESAVHRRRDCCVAVLRAAALGREEHVACWSAWRSIAAAVIIAVIRKDGVFGIFAANHLTELIWAAAASAAALAGDAAASWRWQDRSGGTGGRSRVVPALKPPAGLGAQNAQVAEGSSEPEIRLRRIRRSSGPARPVSGGGCRAASSAECGRAEY